MFKVETRENAEVKMTESNYEFEWVQVEEGSFDCKVISKVLPAVRHSTNGRKTFYNQVIAAYTGWIDKRNIYGQAVKFGDGELIPEAFIKELESFMKTNACVFQWEKGSFVIVDNSVAYHSRQPFEGKRTVYASIADGTKEINLK